MKEIIIRSKVECERVIEPVLLMGQSERGCTWLPLQRRMKTEMKSSGSEGGGRLAPGGHTSVIWILSMPNL